MTAPSLGPDQAWQPRGALTWRLCLASKPHTPCSVHEPRSLYWRFLAPLSGFKASRGWGRVVTSPPAQGLPIPSPPDSSPSSERVLAPHPASSARGCQAEGHPHRPPMAAPAQPGEGGQGQKVSGRAKVRRRRCPRVATPRRRQVGWSGAGSRACAVETPRASPGAFPLTPTRR